MNKSGKRYRSSEFDALDVPLVSRKRPLLHNGAHFTKFSVKLRTLLDQERYTEAKLLFTEMVKSTKYDFKNLWQAGIEVIGRSSPQDLVGYLKAVFISSPPKLSSETFNVYIDQLLIEENWAEALEEMELRYNSPIYHHPIILRKMALCAYHLWDKAYNALPDSYFEEEEHNQYDITHVRYAKYLRTATKYLAEAHNTYLRDSEIFEIYFTFLQKLKDKEMKKTVILKSLSAFEKDPEYYLLFSLMKHNKKDRYFKNEDYIVPLYEFDPFLDEKVKRLHSFCKKSIRKLKLIDEAASEEERTQLTKLLIRIFRLFVNRVEHGNIELWFCKIAVKICTVAMNQEIEDVYFYYNVDELLRSAKSLQRQDAKEISICADQLKDIISDFILQNDSEEIRDETNEDDISESKQLIISNHILESSPSNSFLEEDSFYKVGVATDDESDDDSNDDVEDQNVKSEEEHNSEDSTDGIDDQKVDINIKSEATPDQISTSDKSEEEDNSEDNEDGFDDRKVNGNNKSKITLDQVSISDKSDEEDSSEDSANETEEHKVKSEVTPDQVKEEIIDNNYQNGVKDNIEIESPNPKDEQTIIKSESNEGIKIVKPKLKRIRSKNRRGKK